jgi:hypothetical protein
MNISILQEGGQFYLALTQIFTVKQQASVEL